MEQQGGICYCSANVTDACAQLYHVHQLGFVEQSDDKSINSQRHSRISPHFQLAWSTPSDVFDQLH